MSNKQIESGDSIHLIDIISSCMEKIGLEYKHIWKLFDKIDGTSDLMNIPITRLIEDVKQEVAHEKEMRFDI